MAEITLMICIVLIAYTYAVYPLLLTLMPKKTVEKNSISFSPAVSIVITVHKGADIIEKKLENTLASDYPEEKLEIIVVTDGSDDGTDKIVEDYKDHRVKLIRQFSRMGKTAAQKKGVAQAQYDILVFTDVTTMLEKSSLAQLVSNLLDPRIGLVSSNDRWVKPDGIVTESAQGVYSKYEMWLRNRESEVNSIVSASGCFYAVRREFFEEIPNHLIDDMVIPLSVVKEGARCIHDNQAISLVPMIPSPEKELLRRARMVLGGINALVYMYKLINPFRFGFFSLQLISHKLLRWLVPYLLILVFISNIVLLANGWSWYLAFVMQLAFYAVAFYGHFNRKDDNQPRVVKLIYFFTWSNLAILLAWYKFLFNRKQSIWPESRGK